MSITLIFTILKFLKKNWKEFALFIIVFSLVMTIIYMVFKINSHKKEIDKLEVKVEQLEITNDYLSYEALTFSNKAFVKKTFTNTTVKIVLITNDFYLEEEDLILKENYKYDFFEK